VQGRCGAEVAAWAWLLPKVARQSFGAWAWRAAALAGQNERGGYTQHGIDGRVERGCDDKGWAARLLHSGHWKSLRRSQAGKLARVPGRGCQGSKHGPKRDSRRRGRVQGLRPAGKAPRVARRGAQEAFWQEHVTFWQELATRCGRGWPAGCARGGAMGLFVPGEQTWTDMHTGSGGDGRGVQSRGGARQEDTASHDMSGMSDGRQPGSPSVARQCCESSTTGHTQPRVGPCRFVHRSTIGYPTIGRSHR